MQSAAGEGAGGALFIDTFYFWVIALVAIVTLRVLTSKRPRQYAWAGLNLLFLTFVLQTLVLWVLAAVAALASVLHMYNQPSRRRWLTALILSGASVIFLGYKAGLTRSLGSPNLQQVLVAVGFSFVFLRVFDLVRALDDGRQKPTVAELVNYLLPFHMLAAGPIQSYDEFSRQPGVPDALSMRDCVVAAERVAGGLFKKFVFAYLIHRTFLTNLQASGIWFIIEVQLLLLWLYLDFSAYSDIAVGIGRLMGVSTPENFDHPWLSRNLIEFWDRWHISLSHWIRRNFFIPVQLNLMRRFPSSDPLLIAALAIGVSFFTAGIWHGMSKGWLLWGAMHAVGLVTVRLYSGWMQKTRTPAQIAAYRQNRFLLIAGRALTIEYAAAAFALVFLIK